MRPSQQDLLARWLAAERDDRAEDAEAALLALCEGLPRPEPLPGFADRVLARVGLPEAVAATVQRSLFASRWRRALLAFALLATGLSLFWLPATLSALAGLWSFGDLIQLWTAFFAGVTEALASLVAFGDWLLTLGISLARLLATPTVAGVMTICLVVSTVAFRFLRDLITRERSWIHVEPV